MAETVSLGHGLRLASPVMIAAGPLGDGEAYRRLVDVRCLGAFVTNSITYAPCSGGIYPRLSRLVDGSFRNAVGLANAGIVATVRDRVPLWEAWPIPVIVSIAGRTVDEYACLATALSACRGIPGIEVNVSCPNAGRGWSAREIGEVVRTVRRVYERSILVKIGVRDVDGARRAAEDAGADALTAINTVAGISGPLIRPVALAIVHHLARMAGIPVVGVGGIATGSDAGAFLRAGAVAIQVGSALLTNPLIPVEIALALS